MSKILISHESPITLLPQSLFYNDYDYALVHLFEKYPEYYNFFRESVAIGRHVLLDNSIFELGEAFDMEKFCNWVIELEPTEYIIPDILDDADEITPFEFEFIKAIKQNLKEVYIGYDRNGASRIGFLNADVNTPENIEKLFNHDKKIDLDNPETKINNIYGYSYTRRLEMVHEALKQISELISSGINPGEISIITPQIDKSLKFAISEAFDLKNIDYQYFSGSEKLASVPVVKNILYLLDLAAGSSVDTAKARSIFSDILKIPLKYCIKHVSLFKERGAFEYTDLGIDIYNERLESLIKVLDKIKSPDMLLSDKIFYIYNNLINIEQNEIKQLSALNFFIKQIEDFEAVFKEHKFNPAFQKSFLTQLENSIISENPSTSPATARDWHECGS